MLFLLNHKLFEITREVNKSIVYHFLSKRKQLWLFRSYWKATATQNRVQGEKQAPQTEAELPTLSFSQYKY